MFLISLCAELATDSSFAFASSTALSNLAPPPKDPSNLSLAACISASLRSFACSIRLFCNSICLSKSTRTSSFSAFISALILSNSFCSRSIRLSTRTSSPFIRRFISSVQRSILPCDLISLSSSVLIKATCSWLIDVCSMCALDKKPKIPIDVININTMTAIER